MNTDGKIEQCPICSGYIATEEFTPTIYNDPRIMIYCTRCDKGERPNRKFKFYDDYENEESLQSK